MLSSCTVCYFNFVQENYFTWAQLGASHAKGAWLGGQIGGCYPLPPAAPKGKPLPNQSCFLRDMHDRGLFLHGGSMIMGRFGETGAREAARLT